MPILAGAVVIAMGLLGLHFRREIARGYFEFFPAWMRGRVSRDLWQDFIRFIFAGWIFVGGVIIVMGLVR